MVTRVHPDQNHNVRADRALPTVFCRIRINTKSTMKPGAFSPMMDGWMDGWMDGMIDKRGWLKPHKRLS